MCACLRVARTVLLAAAVLGAAGCELISGPPPRQPIDGLRMTGFDEPRPTAPANQQAELKRMDLRFEGSEG